MNRGLKSVRHRRDDALSRVKWDRLESILADYYRSRGYSVDHCGTGKTRSKFDGGIDLKLRRGSEYLLVQCKHWNAYKVAHNDVHQLLGLVVNEEARGGILVTSGEFTKAAVEAAARQGRIQLIDGDELRDMLGPLPGQAARPPMDIRLSEPVTSAAGAFAANAPERPLTVPKDRFRSDRGLRRGAPKVATASLAGFIIKAAMAVAVLVFAMNMISKIFENLGDDLAAKSRQAEVRRVQPYPVVPQPLPAPEAPAEVSRRQYQQRDQQPVTGVAEVGSRRTEAELREWRRKNAESMKILEASTPEMPLAE